MAFLQLCYIIGVSTIYIVNFCAIVCPQEVLMNPSNSNMGVNSGTSSIEKSRNDDRSSSRSRGWLNWLSRGMLGAGGTDDYSQFSGVVSDEVVKVAVLCCK